MDVGIILTFMVKLTVVTVLLMPGSKKKTQICWEERKLIGIWADILQETNRRMLTRMKKEAVATEQVNLSYKDIKIGKSSLQ